jgi:hypothetical protein
MSYVNLLIHAVVRTYKSELTLPADDRVKSSVVPAGLGTGMRLLVRRLKPTVNKVLSLRDIKTISALLSKSVKILLTRRNSVVESFRLRVESDIGVERMAKNRRSIDIKFLIRSCDTSTREAKRRLFFLSTRFINKIV